MRGIVFGLLFSNLVYLAWNLLVPLANEPNSRGQVAQIGESVQLMSEVSAEQLRRYSLPQTETSIASSEPVGELVEDQMPYCSEIGPFRNEEDAQNFANTNAQRMTLSVDLRQVPASPGYRVYLPPFASRELAVSTQEALRAAFIANNLSIETYLVPRGELENSIALGLFNEQLNALNVQQQMQSLGYQVVVRTEMKQESEVWVLASGIESEDEFAKQWAEMRLSRSYIGAGEKLCETIAHTPQFP